MSFFKSFKLTEDKSVPEQCKRSCKLRYVVDKNGKGRWVRPYKRYSYDYCEDIYC